jgi:hypothetical protein
MACHFPTSAKPATTHVPRVVDPGPFDGRAGNAVDSTSRLFSRPATVMMNRTGREPAILLDLELE